MDDVYPKIAIDKSCLEKNVHNPAPGGGEKLVPIWLEIGFGGAEHLLWQAANHPDVTLFGAEPFLNGVAKAVLGVQRENLSNVRLYHGDARDITAQMPDGCLERVFVLFPDPWPKVRHRKRRILSAEFIAEIHRLLKPGGEFRFASDIIDYVDWTLTRLWAHGGFAWSGKHMSDWRERLADWPSTRYLEKALREGRKGHFFSFERL